MFYKQFLEITSELNYDFVESFDYWLTTLPTNNRKNITASVVSSRLDVSYSQAELILKYAEEKKILERYYLVNCSECNNCLGVFEIGDVASILMNKQYCDECEEEQLITVDDICVAYKVVNVPEITEEELSNAINRKLKMGDVYQSNFTKADSLAHNNDVLYDAFYNPDESAYTIFNLLRKKLDIEYKTSVEKGNALEKLVSVIFGEIQFVKTTTKVKTETNQFDCTVLVGSSTTYPSIFNYLSPYFIIECKNEPEKTPGNTYFNKLIGIINHNEAKIGIVFSRKVAAKTYFKIAREHYLSTKHSKKEILISMNDEDLVYLISDKVNLLNYLDFKVFQVTANAQTVTWEMFQKKS